MTDAPAIAAIDDGLGSSRYLVGLGKGRALAVDAARGLHTLGAATGPLVTTGRHGRRATATAGVLRRNGRSNLSGLGTGSQESAQATVNTVAVTP